jgi:uncharacterized membrane protein
MIRSRRNGAVHGFGLAARKLACKTKPSQGNPQTMNSKISTTSWWLLMLGSLFIAVASYRYLLPHPLIPPDIGKNLMLRRWIFVHAGMASTALILGPFQFLAKLRARAPKVHRWMGRTYVVACLLGGVSGLMLAVGTNAGPIAQAGFGLLAVCWLTANVQAWRLALAGRYAEHRRWMVRSFALTFAAVTLRLYLPIAPMLGYDFMPAYVAISWLCWAPNLMVAELYLNRAKLWRRPEPSRTPVAP